MKQLLALLLCSSILIGCSSNPQQNTIIPSVHYTGGQVEGDVTSLYWYSQKLDKPINAADYVTLEDHSWYKTNYHWSNNILREIAREGKANNRDGQLEPFSVHIRYNSEGAPVYQQYRQNGKVLPLSSDNLLQYLKESQHIIRTVKTQDDKGIDLFQGIWDGEVFLSCDGKVFEELEFNKVLPSFVVSRLSSVESFFVFLGHSKEEVVSISNLLLLADEGYGCIEAPVMIKE
ncbi:MAG: DUF1481 domain-containing protein [Aliivibrio sp.]|uniref:DUF1481 domain-containing protein n=1 Tax=Aliivibrio sp. TaxID=1872443 RepID=UPI001A3A34B8|nr:DUF1481 domain-containing protein [Aliivibrio sp.]